jgi:hypothetical protein
MRSAIAFSSRRPMQMCGRRDRSARPLPRLPATSSPLHQGRLGRVPTMRHSRPSTRRALPLRRRRTRLPALLPTGFVPARTH